MREQQLFEEVRVYDGVAERTGVQFPRDAVRRSIACCRSVTDLIRRARQSGDGYFYLPADAWPAGKDRVELQKPWVVVSSDDHATSGTSR